MNRSRPVIDVSKLPTVAYDTRSTLWWGVMMMIVIEGMMVVLLIATYLYLRQHFVVWPPVRTQPPDLLLGTINMALIALSTLPMYWADRAAVRGERKRPIVIALVIFCVIGAATVVLRFHEFPAMHTKWFNDAYGSIVWWSLGLHLAHLLASVLETIVLVVWLLGHELDEKHRLDVNVNGLYWYFVVAAWLALYFVIYWLPRLL